MRYWGLAVALLASGLVLAPSGGAFYGIFAKWDPPGPDQFLGYLTWDGSRGGIAWDPAAPSQDPGGPPPTAAQDQELDRTYKTHIAARTAQNYATCFAYCLPASYRPVGYAPDPSSMPAPDEFVSQPLPRDVHLNPISPIEVDLALTRYSGLNPCQYGEGLDPAGATGGPNPWLDIQLFVGERRLAGYWQVRNIAWYYSSQTAGPSVPPDHGLCVFVFHLEMLTLPKGSVVKLRVTHVLQDRGFQFGTGGDHRSVIRLPTFADEEWQFRDPSLAATEMDGISSIEDTSGGGLLAVAGLALCAGIGRPRSRRFSALLLAVAIGSAGCIGSTGSPAGAPGQTTAESGGIKTTLLPEGPGNATGNGSVFGVVHDAFRQPLSNVHTSFLGTNYFTDSDAKGRFSILDVPPAKYVMRFDAKGHKSVQAEVEVKAGFKRQLDVTMFPLVEKVGDDRPHVHDYWSGLDTKELMDAGLGAICDGTTCTPQMEIDVPGPEKPGDFQSVIPGTYDIEVIVTWDAAKIPYSRVGLAFFHPGDIGPTQFGSNYRYNSSVLYPRASGESFHIATTWEMSDPGHQAFTSWGFRLEMPTMDEPTGTPLPLPDSSAEYHVKIILHKGLVPYGPAHPDRWAGTTRALVMTSVGVVSHSPLILALGATCHANDPPETVTGEPCRYINLGAPKEPLPAEAVNLEVYLNQSKAGTLETTWDLRYRTALQGESNYDAGTWNRVANPERLGPLSYRYQIQLGPGENDPTYATKSAWAFYAVGTDAGADMVNQYNAAAENFRLDITVFAHKNPD